jgi:hypothetical protein
MATLSESSEILQSFPNKTTSTPNKRGINVLDGWPGSVEQNGGPDDRKFGPARFRLSVGLHSVIAAFHGKSLEPKWRPETCPCLR